MPKIRKDKDVQMLATMKIKRINHVVDLCKAKDWSRDKFIREGMYRTTVSSRTLERAFDGETELSMDTVEQLAKLFKVGKDEILESIF
jgi:hypothetical protein